MIYFILKICRKSISQVALPHKYIQKVTICDNDYFNWFDCVNYFKVYTYIKTSHCTPHKYTIFICQKQVSDALFVYISAQ